MDDINYTKLFFTIMFSITFAILISGTVFKYWFAYEANQLMEQAALNMQKANEKRAHDRIIQTQLSKQRALEKQKIQNLKNTKNQEKQRAAKAEKERQKRAHVTKVKVCKFWQEQYKKYKGNYEKNMMADACTY